jgi:hypothetical protein
MLKNSYALFNIILILLTIFDLTHLTQSDVAFETNNKRVYFSNEINEAHLFYWLHINFSADLTI